MEQMATYDTLRGLNGAAGINTNFNGYAVRYLGGPFPTYRCPSDGEVQLPSNYFNPTSNVHPARTSIRYCMGDGMWNCAHIPGEATGPPITNVRGMFFPLCWKSFSDITDGSSNTIGASEAVCGDAQYDSVAETIGVPCDKVKGGITTGNTITNIFVGNSVVPANCLSNAYDTGDRTRIKSPASAWRGQLFGDGRSVNCGFHTVLPPNSPSCGYSVTNGGQSNQWGVLSASSHHPGGINTLNMDGAVRFISETIDCDDLNGRQGGVPQGAGTQPANSGASNYGVWGALGTPAGGETKNY